MVTQLKNELIFFVRLMCQPIYLLLRIFTKNIKIMLLYNTLQKKNGFFYIAVFFYV